MVEVSQRTIQGRHLLKPSPRFNQIFLGALAKAQGESCIPIHAVVCLSSHFHLLASPQSVEQMATFMCHFQANLSKEVGLLYDWPGTLFDKRYHAIPVSDEPEAHVARLEYLLAQGCKENLVASPREWPGVHSVAALIDEQPLMGLWVDRRRLWAARQRGGHVAEEEFTQKLEVKLSALPCWAHLSYAEYRQRMIDLVDKIEIETKARHQADGTRPAGPSRVLRGSPHRRPEELARKPRPRFHAHRKKMHLILRDALNQFLYAYRRAADRVRNGEWPVEFPAGCFPPRLPFTRSIELLDSG